MKSFLCIVAFLCASPSFGQQQITAPLDVVEMGGDTSHLARLNVRQLYTGSAFGPMLSLDASASYEGHNYGLLSSGPQDGIGNGFFGILDNTVGLYRLAITPLGKIGIGTTTPILTGDTGASFTDPALLSVMGSIAATSEKEHQLKTTGAHNVLAIWSTQNPGTSAIRALNYAGNEMGAWGFAGASSKWGYGGVNGATFIEASNFSTAGTYGNFRIVQTSSNGPITGPTAQRLRLELDEDGNWNFYDLTGNLINGTQPTLIMRIGSNGGVVIGSPAGGNMGPGTINVGAIYKNGVLQ